MKSHIDRVSSSIDASARRKVFDLRSSRPRAAENRSGFPNSSRSSSIFSCWTINAAHSGCAPTDTVLETGGTRPEEFETIVRRYVAQSPFARRRMGRIAKAAWNLAKAMLTATPDVDALAEKLNIPKITHGNLAADTLSWQNSHALLEKGSG